MGVEKIPHPLIGALEFVLLDESDSTVGGVVRVLEHLFAVVGSAVHAGAALGRGVVAYLGAQMHC